MEVHGVGVIWVKEEDYPRFRALDRHGVPETYEAWRDGMEVKLKEFANAGRFPERLLINPEEFAIWANQRFGKIDSKVRAAYAAHLMATRNREGP